MLSKNRTYHPRGQLVDGFAVRNHPLYRTWSAMLSRCTNPNDPNYPNYGGRGIDVCERWYKFKDFAEDMGLKPFPEATLERMDNNAGYSPTNCTWATRSDQCVNRRVFSNNTSDFTGVHQQAETGCWIARFDYENVRHAIGWYKTKEEARDARVKFLEDFFTDRAAALASLSINRARSSSSTGVRGVTPHRDGGFTVRVHHEGARKHLGYFKTFQEACDARSRFIAA